MEETPTPARMKPRNEPLLYHPKTQNMNEKLVFMGDFMHLCIVSNMKVYSVYLLVLLVKVVGGKKHHLKTRKGMALVSTFPC